MDDEATEPAEAPADPITVLQDAIAQIADKGSLCAGFALVAEWFDEDGSQSIQVFHSPMPPWHLYGLLTYARESNCAQLIPVNFEIDDDDDEDF